MIDWTNFTPVSALIGGVMIGIAAAALALLTGRIAGVSGIFGGVIGFGAGDRFWRAAFIAGLIAAPLLSALAGHPLPLPQMPDSWLLIAVAGLLVGFGARLGGGCTSGHGVCGISRLSPRSIVATLVFMATGFATLFVTRHLL